MGLFRNGLTFLILSLYARTKLLLSSLVAHPFNSFFFVLNLREDYCVQPRRLVLYPLVFLYIRLESCTSKRLYLKTNLLKYALLLFRKDPLRIQPIIKRLNTVSWGPRGLFMNHFALDLKLFCLMITAVKAIISCHMISMPIRTCIKNCPPTY